MNARDTAHSIHSCNNRAEIRSGVFIIGLLLIVVLCGVTAYNNYFLQNSKLSGNHLPVGSILALFFLAVFVNVPLKKFAHHLAFSSSELIVIWVMLIVTLGIPSMGFLQFLLPTLVAISYFATPENDWSETLHHHIPEWLVISDRNAVRNFYEGVNQSGFIPWSIWLKPLCIWTLFALVFYFTTLCLSILLRKQWIEHEHFSFPLVQIPLEIAAASPKGQLFNAFFKNRFLWLGMSLPILLHLINGLHAHFPNIPEIPRIYNIHRMFHGKPWHTLGWWPAVRIVIYFSVIGIAAMLTLEVSFSLWFFFLFFKLQYIIMNAIGLEINPWISCSRQVMGGYLIFVPAIFWIGRGHFFDVIRKTFSRGNQRLLIDDTNEPLPYRKALLGFLIGFTTIVIFCWIAGISVWVSLIVMLAIFITSIVLSWMVVNGGLLLVQAPFFPSEYITIVAGSSVIDSRSLALLGFQRGFFRDWGEFMMPNFLHNFRVLQGNKFSQKKILSILFLSITVAVIVSAYTSLDLIYGKGALNLQRWVYVNAPRNYFQQMSNMIQFPTHTRWNEVYSMIGGASFTFFLLWVRHHFIWWSLHPIGYLLGATYPPFHLWFSVFVGWLIKYCVLKFSGPAGNNKLRFVCLGLILGEYLMVGLWMIIGLFTKIGYFALPS